MQAYWPFHKAICYRNEFADLTQASEPKFARWMRKHQKLAVLKDDEVDRLERASVASTGDAPGLSLSSFQQFVDMVWTNAWWLGWDTSALTMHHIEV